MGPGCRGPGMPGSLENAECGKRGVSGSLENTECRVPGVSGKFGVWKTRDPGVSGRHGVPGSLENAGSPTFSMSVVGTRRNSKHSACLITKFAAYGYLQEMVAKV